MSATSSREIETWVQDVDRQIRTRLMDGPRSSAWSYQRRVLDAALQNAREITERERKYQKRQRRTRSYTDSFLILGPSTRGDKVYGVLRNTHPAARAMEHGSRDHPVKAVNADFLEIHLPGKVGTESIDTVMFRKEVMTGGIKQPRHIIKRAMAQAIRDVNTRRR